MTIDDSEKLVLKNNQNFFSIEYAALDFTLTDNILYAYKLDGFDNDWVYVQKQRIANYADIPEGEYVFRVKSTNSEGIWGDNERTLPIKVLPSFWETPTAMILYMLLFSLLVSLSVYIPVTFYRLRNNVETEKQMPEERKSLQEIYRAHLISSATIELEPQPFITTSRDGITIQKVVEIIEKNMDNDNFTVEELYSTVGMSRSVFFNKIKSLTGLSPIEFIRDIKLKRAAQLLSLGEFMVKEVSYMIGILDTKYFAKIFKIKYGMSPQEYKNMHYANQGLKSIYPIKLSTF
jgi:AraC-like DNA-binding protein